MLNDVLVGDDDSGPPDPSMIGILRGNSQVDVSQECVSPQILFTKVAKKGN